MTTIGDDSGQVGGQRRNLNEDIRETSSGVAVTCGCGSWQPLWLQRFATPRMFLVNFSIIAILQGASFTYLLGSMSTLEKRYGFDSKVSGFILIADNLSQMVINPFIGYLGTRFNRPKMIAIGECIVALSCFMCSLPYFIFGPARSTNLMSTGTYMNTSTNDFQLCSSQFHPEDCSTSSGATTNWYAVGILWVASFINGCGYTPFYTVGIPYLDDITKKKNSAFYLSASSTLRLLGPTAGLLLSAACLRLYEDPFDDPGIRQTDPRFIGAWWIGYEVIGVLLIIFSLPLMLFPRDLHHKKSKMAAAMNLDVISGTENTETEKGRRRIWSSLMRLAKNPIFVFNMLGNAIRILGYCGYYIFKPKYLEAQYQKSASTSNAVTGVSSIFTMAVGIMMGGIFIGKWKPSPRKLCFYIFSVELVTNAAIIIALFLQCPNANTTERYFGKIDHSFPLNLTQHCNAQCSCTTKSFTPVCAMDKTTPFVSPCFAGCTDERQQGNTKIFSNCACLPDRAQEVMAGRCPSSCGRMFELYIVVMSVAGFVSATARTGNTLVTLRCVEPEDKSFALGIIGSFMAIFAFTPYPIIFGAITDAACLVWKKSCGKTGNCWLYDTEKLAYYLHVSAFIFMSIGSLFDIPIIVYANRIKSLYDDDEECSRGKKFQLRTEGEVNPAFRICDETVQPVASIGTRRGLARQNSRSSVSADLQRVETHPRRNSLIYPL